jgi:hypothetical protein
MRSDQNCPSWPRSAQAGSADGADSNRSSAPNEDAPRTLAGTSVARDGDAPVDGSDPSPYDANDVARSRTSRNRTVVEVWTRRCRMESVIPCDRERIRGSTSSLADGFSFRELFVTTVFF